MEKSRQLLIGFAIAFILIAGGFASGFYFNQHKRISSTGTQPVNGSSVTQTETPPAPVHNTTVYQASPPSKGQAYRATTLALDNIASHIAVVYLPAAEAKGIATGQSVLMYDKSGLLLNIIGTVESVVQGSGKFANLVTVTITVADTPDIPATRAATAQVITETIPMADRLPMSALQKAPDGTFYIWEAVRQMDGSTKAVKRIPAQIDILNANFFIVRNSDYVSDVYLLNPDQSLQDGQAVSVERTMYQAPDTRSPDEIAMIQSDAIDYYRHQIGEIQFYKAIHTPMGGCPASANLTNDFIAKVKSMASDDTKGKVSP